MTLADSTQTSV